MYSRKDTLKDHIRGKHNIGLAGELNRLVQVFVPQEESGSIKEGKQRKNKNAEQKTVPISSLKTLYVQHFQLFHSLLQVIITGYDDVIRGNLMSHI